jgi:hypothetical protein
MPADYQQGRFSSLGPRGTGKTSSCPQQFPDALRIDLQIDEAPAVASVPLDEYNVWCGHIRRVKPGSHFAQVGERRISSV